MTDDAQIETIEHHIFELEHPIIDVESLHETMHKLVSYIERDDALKDVMQRVIDDIGCTAVALRKRFDLLHAVARGSDHVPPNR